MERKSSRQSKSTWTDGDEPNYSVLFHLPIKVKMCVLFPAIAEMVLSLNEIHTCVSVAVNELHGGFCFQFKRKEEGMCK